MAGKRKRGKAGDEVADGGRGDDGENVTGGGYEEMRQQRMRENKERMQSLGILDLSLKLIRPTKPRNSVKNIKPEVPVPNCEHSRRSSRIKTLNPVSYSEIRERKKSNSPKNVEIRLREGSQPEIYSEEHEKLLGDCNTPWTLYVDGCDENGKRIYDSINGETCHQCRQKTLGRHTHCSECNTGYGQFCGDCLYMRYGENVIETEENPKWVCPVCREICNCSLCRQAKGWMPTGNLYRKVIKLGFKSVAHYLIQTRGRSEPNSHGKPISDAQTPSESSHERSTRKEEDEDEDEDVMSDAREEFEDEKQEDEEKLQA